MITTTRPPRGLLLLAAGGLAREVLAALETTDRDVIGLLDDDLSRHRTRVGGAPVLGPIGAVVDHPDAELLVCAGRGAARAAIVRRLAALGVGDDRFATVVDTSVRVPSSCRIGGGSIVLAGTVLTADVTVGRHVVIMPNVTLTHDDRIDEFATLCAGVTLGGTVHVGQTAYLGMSSCVRENLSVGPDAVLGMGATLTRDLPADQTWVGTPAHPLPHPAPTGARAATTREELSA